MIPASEWVDAQVVWIVTLRWAGHVWYFADARVRMVERSSPSRLSGG